jgi:hypothetical protein
MKTADEIDIVAAALRIAAAIPTNVSLNAVLPSRVPLPTACAQRKMVAQG